MFIPTPNAASVEWRYLIDEQQVENRVNFILDAPPSTGDLENLANACAAWRDAELRPLQASAVQLREVYVTDQSAVDAPTFSLALSPPLAGGVAADPLPNNCSLCISFRTANRGRSARGRLYHIGLAENQQVASSVLGSVANALLAAYQALPSYVAPVGWQMAVISKTLNKVARTEGFKYPITTIGIVDLVIDSQRRRLPSRGT